MAIRNKITNMRSGVIGSIAYDGPTRAMSKILLSTKTDGAITSALPNYFGHAYTLDTTNDTAKIGGDGKFLGLLVNPHAYAIDEAYAENGKAGELLHMGEVFVNVCPAVTTDKTSVAPVVGGKAYYVAATGQITADPNDQAATALVHKEIKGSVFTRATPVVDSNGCYLAVLSLTGLQA